jgi:hypothetical protein
VSSLVPREANLPEEALCPNCFGELAADVVPHCPDRKNSEGEVARCGWVKHLVCHATVDPRTRAYIPAGGAS